MQPRTKQLLQEQRWDEAELALIQEVAARPRDAEILFHLGRVQGKQGRIHDGAGTLRRCLAVAPRNPSAAMHLSAMLVCLGRVEESIVQAELAVAGAPLIAEAHMALATAYAAAYQMERALAAVTRALSLKPGVTDWKIERMKMLRFVNRHEEAVSVARQLAIRPELAKNPYLLEVLIEWASDQCEWEALESYQDQYLEGCRQTGLSTLPMQAAFWVEEPHALHGRPESVPWSTVHANRGPSGSDNRLVIGYLSADIREHPVAHMLVSILERHDRSRFEIVLVAIGHLGESPLTLRVRSLVDRIIDVIHLDDHAAAQHIMHRDRVDVLVDLMGITKGFRPHILALRPAPIQLLWMGCPVTTGMGCYQAFLADDHVMTTAAEQGFSEPVIRLPTCYHPISSGLHGDLPNLTRTDVGLPEGVFLIGMPQSLSRLKPSWIRTVCNHIATLSDVHLVLRIPDRFQERVRTICFTWGLPKERVHFLGYFPSREHYLAGLGLLDLILDTTPYGGHSTAGEALTMGIPLLTCPGTLMPSRVASSMMATLGLGHRIPADQAEQFRWLGELAQDSALRGAWRRDFAEARARIPAANTALVTALESVYASPWVTASSGPAVAPSQGHGP